MPDKKWRLFKDRSAWRCWLESNHDRAKEIRLVYYKKNSGKKSVRYEDALEEALCFGWIDSVVNRVDDERYMQKYTPRKDASIWSAANKARVRKLIARSSSPSPRCCGFSSSSSGNCLGIFATAPSGGLVAFDLRSP